MKVTYQTRKSLKPMLLLLLLLLGATAACGEAGQEQLATIAAHAAATALAEGEQVVATQAAALVLTAESAAATQIAVIATDIADRPPSPWDTSWLPSDDQFVAGQIDGILAGSGMAGQGTVTLQFARLFTVNPAFALAMFRKEANFAAPSTRAYRNNNPGNIIATGDCRDQRAGQPCSGVYGETSTDGRFGVYSSLADGIRAYFMLLDREYRPGIGRDCADIACIISAYCPPAECDVAAYVAQSTDWTKQYQREILSP